MVPQIDLASASVQRTEPRSACVLTPFCFESARNYRRLRSLGVTIRGTVHMLIATRCLANGLTLLHSDRDFEAFQQHLGL